VTPLAEYQSRLAQRRAVSEREERRFRWIGNVRLIIGICGVIVAFFVFGETIVSPWWLVLPAAVFAGLVVLHSRVVESWERADRAVKFYERGMARLENRWAGSGEAGERFRNASHVYEEDLDLFGKGSLFELLSAARTRSGEDTLAQWLLIAASNQEAAARQQAIQELRPRLDMREDLAIRGEGVRSNLDQDAVAAWGEAPEVSYPAGARVIAPVLAGAVVITFGLYIGSVWTRTPFLIALLLAFGYWALLGARTLRVTAAVNAPARDLALLSELLEQIENDRFEAPLLREVQGRLAESGVVASKDNAQNGVRREAVPDPDDGAHRTLCASQDIAQNEVRREAVFDPDGGARRTLCASAEIAKLERLVSLLDWQRNLLFAPIAFAILWSPQLALAIERWRVRSGRHIREWIAGIGEFEALCDLATYSYEHPGDTFPELTETSGGWFEAEGLGHPLMPEAQCVRNDVGLGGETRLLIVSGSNMSGKSTLLRAVGLNTVLAWAGAPVRANRLKISPLIVGASIRVLDSLLDGRSRFYAEITRLREIVRLAEGSRTVLFLVDELLSGTNSHDRRIGAAAIVRMLLDRGAIGMITTHDLALVKIADDMDGRTVNVHFADSLEDGRLHFDYRLLPGVVERSNALDLMRSVGLEV
jgi:hypothetical protein